MPKRKDKNDEHALISAIQQRQSATYQNSKLRVEVVRTNNPIFFTANIFEWAKGRWQQFAILASSCPTEVAGMVQDEFNLYANG